MSQAILYTTSWCPFCVRALQLLRKKGVEFENIDIDADPGRRGEMMEKSGRRTVPQIWIQGEHIGGCDELFALERSGRLDAMLNTEEGSKGE